MADVECNTCCWAYRETFPGIKHSGDIIHNNDLLDFIKISEELSTEKDIAIVISGYQYTKLARFQGSNPVVMVANHTEKVKLQPRPLLYFAFAHHENLSFSILSLFPWMLLLLERQLFAPP